MNSPSHQRSGWGWRPWLWILGGGLVAHLGLVFAFGERTRPPAELSAPKPWMEWVVESHCLAAVIEAPQLSDPTLLALPSGQGFSGPAWLELVGQASPSFQWVESPSYLALDTNDLGLAFLQFRATNKYESHVLQDLFQPASSTADILLFNDPGMTQSLVRLEGPLAGRLQIHPLVVRDPVSADLLADTVVQVRADREGAVESAMVVSGSGLKSADEQALAAVRLVRFCPLPSAGAGRSEFPSWGKFVFQWLPVPPSATSPVPGGPR
jgi:TonB family protein